MMNVGEVKMTKADDVPDIDVDIDDNGYAYIKQRDMDGPSEDDPEWVCLPVSKVPELIAALQEIRIP